MWIRTLMSTSPAERWKMASVKMAATQALTDPDSVPPTAKPDDAQVPEFLKKIAKQIGLSSPLVVHVIFVLLWTFWLLNARDSEMSYAFSTLVRERILYSELLPSEDEVATLSTISHLWKTCVNSCVDHFWMGYLVIRFLAWGPFDQGWVNDQARMVGAARIRQIRAATNSCAVSLLRVLTLRATRRYPMESDALLRCMAQTSAVACVVCTNTFHQQGPMFLSSPGLVHTYLVDILRTCQLASCMRQR